MSMFIGVRVEMSNKSNKIKDIDSRYKSKYDIGAVADYHDNGKIVVERRENMLVVHGKQEDRFPTGLVNFSVLSEIEGTNDDINRVIKIVNVLGNDRLIKEKVRVFVDGKSMLNNIEELKGLVKIFANINTLAPGFVDGAWYYAPETLELDI